MPEDISYRFADYDGGLEAHPVPEHAGELRLVDSWWELHFKHTFEIANGELSDYVLEATAVDERSCLVSIRDVEGEREILCSFVLPRTATGRFLSDLDQRMHELARARVGEDAESGDGSLGWEQGDGAAPGFEVWPYPTAGERLAIVPRDPTLPWGNAGFSTVSPPFIPDAYEVRSPDGLIGLLGFGGQAGLAAMACADGSWRLTKRHRIGWNLEIESSDGDQVGSYSGRRWLSGGAISLIGGAHVDLRRTFNGHHTLRVAGKRDSLLDIRTSGSRTGLTMDLTVLSTPTSTTQFIVVTLTACAVLALELMTVSVRGAGGGA